jgi:hypothetical protein
LLGGKTKPYPEGFSELPIYTRLAQHLQSIEGSGAFDRETIAGTAGSNGGGHADAPAIQIVGGARPPRFSSSRRS